MLISASPINQAVRLETTNYYAATSSKASGTLFRINVVNYQSNDPDLKLIVQDYSTSASYEHTCLTQIPSSNTIMVGPTLQVYPYTTFVQIKETTETMKMFYLDCIDSSTCIGLTDFYNRLAVMTNSDFLGTSGLTFGYFNLNLGGTAAPFTGLRCFESNRYTVIGLSRKLFLIAIPTNTASAVPIVPLDSMATSTDIFHFSAGFATEGDLSFVIVAASIAP